MTKPVKWFLAIGGIFAVALAFEKSAKFGGLLVILLVGGMLITANTTRKI
jgi:hypothetical protein